MNLMGVMFRCVKITDDVTHSHIIPMVTGPVSIAYVALFSANVGLVCVSQYQGTDRFL